MIKRVIFLSLLFYSSQNLAQYTSQESQQEALDEAFLLFLLEWEMPESKDKGEVLSPIIDAIIEREAEAKRDEIHEQ